LDIVLALQLVTTIVVALFVTYNVFHYVLFLLVTQLKDASKIGHELNQFEQRQPIEWTPQPNDFLKHDDEKRTYDDVFGAYRDEQANCSTCVFPRVAFSRPYEAEYVLLKPKEGMRVLDLGCGSGAAAYYLASRRDIEIVCVTNSSVQADICRRKFAKLGGRGQVIVTDFDSLDLPSESFDAIYALESIGYTKNLDAWLVRCWRMPGGSLLIRSPGSLDRCRRKEDLPERHRLLRKLALQFCRRQSSRLQDAPTRLQPDPLSATAILGLGPHVELHSTLGVVEVSAKDANIRGIGADHLAHFEGFCLRQPVQHGAGYQARASIMLPADSCTLRSIGWRCRD
jgi:SAM-dependent methyltransferase